MDTLRQDLRYAVRSLRTRPVFTVIALFTLALGIGATSAMFSVVNTVVLRQLPYRDAERLVQIWETPIEEPNGQVVTSPANYADWRSQTRTLTDVGAFRFRTITLTGEGEPEQIRASMMTPSLLRVLGVEPELGRWFREEEGIPGAAPTVLLSHQLWRQRYGADPTLVGRTITIDGQAATVVGVMPESFRFPMPTMYPILRRAKIAAWIPFPVGPDASRGTQSLGVIARLAGSTTVEQATSELAAIHRRIGEQFSFVAGNTVRLVPLPQQVAGEVRRPLLVLLGAVALLLLVACANVANLVLARSLSRRRELSVRIAIGAGRGRLVRLLMTENLVLGLAGGVLGLLIAKWGVSGLIALIPAGFPRVSEIGVDARVAAFALIASVVTGVLFGTWPALRASAAEPHEVLLESGRGNSESRRTRRGADLLVATQLAVSVVLLVGASLLIRSFVRLAALDPGFNTQRLIAGSMILPQTKYAEHERQIALYDAVLEKLRAQPGLEDVTLSGLVPYGGSEEFNGFSIAGRPPIQPGEQSPSARFYVVAPNYLSAMRIPLLRGRHIADTDRLDAPGAVVINQSAAQKFWPNEDPLGQRIAFGANRELTVIGIAGDVRFNSLDAQPVPEIYVPYRQFRWPFMGILVRARGNTDAVAATLRNAVRSLDPDQPISEVRTMDRMIGESYAQRRLNMMLLGGFSVLALTLSIAGLYGVLAQTVSRRTHESGVRMALGAESHSVIAMVVKRGMRVALLGLAAGAAVAFPLAAVLQSQLFGVSARDPFTFVVVPVALAVAALVASYLPARRATRVDPMIALRRE